MHMTRRTLLGGTAALSALPFLTGVSASADQDGLGDTLRAIEAAWRDDLNADGLPGGTLLIARRGEVLLQAQNGQADIEASLTFDTGTLVHWASITKVFTAVAAMQARDAGLISLDDPAEKYLPELRDIRNPFGSVDEITVARLLSHTSGLRAQTFPWGGDDDWQPHEPARWEQIAAMMPYTELEFKPGEKFGYSNLGLSIVGRILETVYREDFATLTGKNVLRPLGMDDSYFNATPPYLTGRRAANYTIAEDGTRTPKGKEVQTGATLANGGLNGTIGDLKRFSDFVLGNPPAPGFEILKPETLTEMLTLRARMGEDSGDTIDVGLGFFLVTHKLPDGTETRLVGHAGFQEGWRSMLQMNPDTGLAFIAAANANRQKGRPWTANLRDRIYADLLPKLERWPG